MKKWTILLFLVLLCALLLPAQASLLAADDTAAVLTEETREDLEELSRRLQNRTGIRLQVVTRHFLGGGNKAAYAKTLLESSPDPDNTLLLLMVIGEEDYTAVTGAYAGQMISDAFLDTQLATAFRPAYMQRQYSEAAGRFMLAAARQIAASSGERLDTSGLFGENAYATQAPKQEEPDSAYWWEDFFTESAPVDHDEQLRTRRQMEDISGLSFWNLVVIAFVLYFIFGRGKKNRDGCGCGCGPFSYLLAVFGLADLFGLRKK